VQLFVTCLVDSLFPHVGESVVRVLERAGLTVEFPFDQTCCGQPAFNAGFPDEARAMARHTIDVLVDTDGPIVVPSGSCAQMIIDHAPSLLAADNDYLANAQLVSARTREFTMFLVDDLAVTAPGVRRDATFATYHPSCHGLRGLGITTQPMRLLEGIAGLKVVDLPDAETCCGFGGIFSVEMPEISVAMLATKLDNVAGTGADVLVGGDVGCLMHMEGGLRRRADADIAVVHIAELLDGRET
jgi:L-lactate dehydrogenase complex protein LldE